MKLKFIFAAIIAAMSLMVGAAITSSCDKAPWQKSNYDRAEDSIFVATLVDEIVNPQFYEVSDIVSFQVQSVEGFSIDSIFQTMPEQVLRNVACVVLGNKGFVDKREVVKEYQAHPDIYNNLPNSSSGKIITSAEVNEVDKTGTDLGDKPSGVISTSYSYSTDTVDGKPVKIQIKTEKSYAE